MISTEPIDIASHLKIVCKRKNAVDNFPCLSHTPVCACTTNCGCCFILISGPPLLEWRWLLASVFLKKIFNSKFKPHDREADKPRKSQLDLESSRELVGRLKEKDWIAGTIEKEDCFC